MYKTYVISLYQPDKLLMQLTNYGLDPILIEGIKGSKLDDKTIEKNTTDMYALFGPKSAIGCAMSHIKTWKEFLKTDADYAIIFEDDVVFEKNFKNELNDIIKIAPKEYDILYLGCFGCNNQINIFTYLSSIVGLINLNSKKLNKFINKPVVAYATHSYIVSRNGANKLLKYIEGNISNHIDFQMNKLMINNKINVYALNKRIVYQTSTDETQSNNNSNNHPIILYNILADYYVDKKVKANYLSSLSVLRINNINLTLISFAFILFGILCSSIDIDLSTITILYLLISLPDIYLDKNNPIIKIHYLLLIVPYIILKYLNIWYLIDNKQ